MKFENLGLAEPILRAVTAEGYAVPTPIQVQAIPHVLAGRDLLGCAQTGTGKTAAFALPILHRLAHTNGAHRRVRPIRVLVLAPTRELAAQIGESFRAYGRHTGLRGVVIYGGVNQNRQTNALHGGTDILVATPGRLLDLMEQGYIDLAAVEVLVLDEADRMLDMGFIHDIRKIVAKVPKARQTLFFSATMPPEIRRLADNILTRPVSVQVAPESATADNVEQSVYHVKKKNKPVLLRHLLQGTPVARCLVFTRTKSGANRVARQLHAGGIASEALHGNKSQNARERAIANFKTSKTHVLVATDIAARGLDIDGISHVVNYDVPNIPETYVHRIGRTARAGACGVAVSFCDPEERDWLKAIEQLTRQTISVNHEHPEYPAVADSHEADDRSPQSPIHRPRRPKPVAMHPRGRTVSRGHSASRGHDAPAPARDRVHGKPGHRQSRSGSGAAPAPHSRREDSRRPGGPNQGGQAPRRDTAQRSAAHHGATSRGTAQGERGTHAHGKPAPAPVGVGLHLRGRGRKRRGRGAGPRR